MIDTVRKRGFKQIGTDYAVPLDRNRDMLRIYHQRLDAADIGTYMCFGHIGDAHVHINVLPETPEQAATATALLMDLAKEVIALGGTISAEHGLGKQKAPLLKLQYSAEHIEAMMAVRPSGSAMAAGPRHAISLPAAVDSVRRSCRVAPALRSRRSLRRLRT